MKKILGLTVAALMVMGLVGGGTWAYFSDPETGQATISAGTLDLTIDSANDPVTILDVSAAQPGGSGGNYTALYNNGSATGNLSVAIASITNTESTADGTEFTNDSIGSGGELGGAAQMALYIDVDDSTGYTTGDIGLKSDGNTYNHPTSLDYANIDDYDSLSWDNIRQMTAGDTDNLYVLWQIPYGSTADNTYQGDSVSVNMTITLRSP
jgi:spore coat-associated protein N